MDIAGSLDDSMIHVIGYNAFNGVLRHENDELVMARRIRLPRREMCRCRIWTMKNRQQMWSYIA